MDMNWRDYIDAIPGVLSGRPKFKHVRISVQHLLDVMSAGWTNEMIFDSYPEIKLEHILAALAFASELSEAPAAREVAFLNK